MAEFIVISIIVFAIFTISILLSPRKKQVERGRNSVYSERCGGTHVPINFTYPFVRLSLYDDFMVLKCWTSVVIKYKEIKRLEKRNSILGTGIELIPFNINKFGHPIIWSFNRDEVLNIIKERMKEL